MLTLALESRTRVSSSPGLTFLTNKMAIVTQEEKSHTNEYMTQSIKYLFLFLKNYMCMCVWGGVCAHE